MNNQQIKNMFEHINMDCSTTGESVVPITLENLDYYQTQMQNLDFSQAEIDSFSEYLK